MLKILLKRKLAAAFAILLSVVIAIVGVTHCFTAKYMRIAKEQTEGEDYRLILAMMKAESNFDEKAVSNKGAVGLMQIMPATGEWISNQMMFGDYTESKLYDAETNVKIGACYIVYLKGMFSHDMALAAYNAGPERVAGWIEEGITSVDDIPFEETRRYVKKVNFYYLFYSVIYLF